jgi:hypothetical protein
MPDEKGRSTLQNILIFKEFLKTTNRQWIKLKITELVIQCHCQRYTKKI